MPRPGDPFNFRPSRDPSLSSLSRSGLAREPAPSLSLGEPRVGAQPSLLDPSQPEMSVELIQEPHQEAGRRAQRATTSEPRPDRRPSAPTTPRPCSAARSKRCRRRRERCGPARRCGCGARRPSATSASPAWWPTPEPAAGPAGRARRAAAAQPPARAHRRGGRRRAHGGAARADPRAGRRPAAPFRGERAAATAEGATLDQSEYRARRARLRPDAAHRRRPDDPRRAHGAAARRARPARLGAGDDGRRVAHRRGFPRGRGGRAREAARWASCCPSPRARCATFTPGHARRSATWRPLGFRFALEEVTDLDMDFAGLKDMGFAFVKLDAPVFLDGLPAAGGRMPASDICRHLADFGLTPDRRPHRGRLAAGAHSGLRRAVRQRHAVRRRPAGEGRGGGRARSRLNGPQPLCP